MSVQKLLNRGLCGLIFGGAFTALAAVPAHAIECGVNLFNPKLLSQADFVAVGETQYKGLWNGHLNRYVEKYPFGFVSGRRYKITYKLNCDDTKAGSQYLTFLKTDDDTIKMNSNACNDGRNGLVEIVVPDGTKIKGLRVETIAGEAPYTKDVIISDLMVTDAGVDTARYISYNPCTRVATQVMLDNSSYGTRDRLNYVANVISDLITQSKTNTQSIDRLSQKKQTRPADGCAEGYDSCLLVKDTDGENVWYPIETCNGNSFLYNVGENIELPGWTGGTYRYGGWRVDNTNHENCNATGINCANNQWVRTFEDGLVYGEARAVSIAENTRGTMVTLPNDVQSGGVCVCRATGYRVVNDENSYNTLVPVSTDLWVISGLTSPDAVDSDCISSCAMGGESTDYDVAYYATIANTCLDSLPSATAVDPNAFEPKFTVTTTQMGTSDTFNFRMSAQGNFQVNCGEGGTLGGTGVSGNRINRASDTTMANYTCTYTTPGVKTIEFGGTPTAYNADVNSFAAAISFNNNEYVSSVSGSLGELFPTLGNNDGQQPAFSGTFNNCPHLTAVPAGLFDGVTGSAPYMFDCTFCSTGLVQIPANLFGGISGAAPGLFRSTFSATNISQIPSSLFSHVSGGAEEMFKDTFAGCSNITSIPENLFNGVNVPARSMFYDTFVSTGITSIPGNLFSHVHGSADSMFTATFMQTNISSIPSDLFSTITGGAQFLFHGTFDGCSHLTAIPDNLFSGINQAADHMFYRTFSRCSNLGGYIPASAFSGLINAGSPYSSNMWLETFGTGLLATSCPTGTTQVTTEYEQYWNNRVACRPD